MRHTWIMLLQNQQPGAEVNPGDVARGDLATIPLAEGVVVVIFWPKGLPNTGGGEPTTATTNATAGHRATVTRATNQTKRNTWDWHWIGTPRKWVQQDQFDLQNTPENFTAGKTRDNFISWKAITSDSNILSWIAAIDFTAPIEQESIPQPITFTDHDCALIDLEIQKLQRKHIIEETKASPGQFVSYVFFWPKKNGNFRLILNLKELNWDVEYYHFKMETLHHAIQLITPGCYMASVDLKDAYYSIPVRTQDRIFLCFHWKEVLYQFTCLPNSLAEAPQKFTKM